MDRRKFIFKTGSGILLLSGIGSLMQSCVDDNFMENITNNATPQQFKSSLNGFCQKSISGNFVGNSDIFLQQRIIILVDNYEVLDKKVDNRNREVDNVLKLNSNTLIKCNFDIYNYSYDIKKVVNREKINDTIIFFDNEIGYYMTIYKKKIQYEFPILFESSTSLKEGYKKPCLMSNQDFSSFVKNKEIINLI